MLRRVYSAKTKNGKSFNNQFQKRLPDGRAFGGQLLLSAAACPWRFTRACVPRSGVRAAANTGGQ
eukprot:4170846-Lingulodinium_polyedra.AAC.1